MANEQLHAAKTAKNDEFYTQYSDIEAEMNAYVEYNKDVFRDKVILCPCDDPEWSNFTKYFATRFETLGLKKLICTSYAKSAGNKQISDYERKSPQFDETKHFECGKLFILDKDTNGSGRIDKEDIQWQYLEGDGDFRSEEVTRLRDEADFIITNPPFSLWREFLAWILEGNKGFSILGNQNAITYKEVFPHIRNNELWLGPSIHSGGRWFRLPDDAEWYSKNAVERDGHMYINTAGNRWFTNIDHGERHEPMKLATMADNLKYNKSLIKKFKNDYGKLEYPKYDNYDAIEVPITKCIPSDYDGVMGVPITFLDKYCPEQFEIVAFRKGEDGKDLVFTREREREREFNHTFVSLFDGCSRIDEQSERYKSEWEEYLCQNNNKKEIEPIDYFFPPLSIGYLASHGKYPKNIPNEAPYINGRWLYNRILIRRKQDV